MAECDRTRRKSARVFARESVKLTGRDIEENATATTTIRAKGSNQKANDEATHTSTVSVTEADPETVDAVTLAAWLLVSMGKDSPFFSARPPITVARFHTSGTNMYNIPEGIHVCVVPESSSALCLRPLLFSPLERALYLRFLFRNQAGLQAWTGRVWYCERGGGACPFW